MKLLSYIGELENFNAPMFWSDAQQFHKAFALPGDVRIWYEELINWDPSVVQSNRQGGQISPVAVHHLIRNFLFLFLVIVKCLLGFPYQSSVATSYANARINLHRLFRTWIFRSGRNVDARGKVEEKEEDNRNCRHPVNRRHFTITMFLSSDKFCRHRVNR